MVDADDFSGPTANQAATCNGMPRLNFGCSRFADLLESPEWSSWSTVFSMYQRPQMGLLHSASEPSFTQSAFAQLSAIRQNMLIRTEAQAEAGRKLFELVHADKIIPAPRQIRRAKQLRNVAIGHFIMFYEANLRKRRERLTSKELKPNNHSEPFAFRLSLINEKFRMVVKQKGIKMTLVVRGCKYVAYVDGMEIWTLNRAVIYELGFVPSRIWRLKVEKIDQDDLNNLNELRNLFEEIEHLAISLVPVTNLLSVELAQSLDKTLKTLECSAPLLKNPLIRNLELTELSCTNVSWVDSLDEIFSFRAKSLVLNSTPVFHCFNTVTTSLTFLYVVPGDVDHFKNVFRVLLFCFPNLKRLELSCCSVVVGEMSDEMRSVPETCMTAMDEVLTLTDVLEDFEFVVRIRSYEPDVLHIISADTEEISKTVMKAQPVRERLTATQPRPHYRAISVYEYLVDES